MNFWRQTLSYTLAITFLLNSGPFTLLAHSEQEAAARKTPAQSFNDKVSPDFVQKFLNQEGEGLSKEWDKSLEQSMDAQLAAQMGGESDTAKAQQFLTSIEALRVSAFAQGSANPNSRYFYNHPLDVWQLLGQNVVLKENDKPQVPFVDPSKLYLEVIDSKDQVVNRISSAQKYITAEGGRVRGGEISKTFSVVEDVQAERRNETFRFRLTYQDKVLHVFENNLVSAQFIGKYLVFVDPSRINKLENTINLSFIDLDFFSEALGKTVLPIFRLPLKVDDANLLEVPESIKIRAEGSSLNVLDKQLTPKVLDVFANLQRPLYNQSVSLVDPNYYESVAPIVAELTTEFENAARSASEYSQQEFDRAGVTKEVMNGFITTLRQETNLRLATGPKVADPKSEGPNAKLTHELERLQTENLTEIDAIIVENIDNPDLWPEGTEKKTILSMSEDEKTELRQRALDVLHDKISKNVLSNIAKAKKLADELMTDELVQKSIGSITPALTAQRKLLARVHMLWLRMTMPQPLGAPKIQEALAIVAAGVSMQNSLMTPGLQWTDLTKEGLARFFANRKVRVATPILVGAILGLGYPAEFAQFMYGGLDVIQQVGNMAMGKASDLWQLTKESVQVSFEWLNPTQIYERFLAAEQLPKLTTGVIAVGSFLGLVFGALHTAANSASYIKSLRGGLWEEARAKSSSWLGAVKNSFIMHMDRDKKTYYQILAKAEEDKLKRDAKKAEEAMASDGSLQEAEKLHGTAQEDAEAERLVQAARDKDQKFSRMFEVMREWPILRSIFGKSEHGINSFAKALTHFLIGYSTWTHSTYLFGRIWNPWFISRNFWYRPRAVLTMLVYPNYFDRSIWGPDKPESLNGLTPQQYLDLEKSSHFPTEYNGGQRPIYKTKIFQRWFGSKETKKRLDELKEFEKGIMPVEAELYKASMRAAYTHMFTVAGQDPELIAFLREGAIESPTDPRINKMSSRLQYYFRAYFTKTFELSMKVALKQAIGTETLPDEDGDLKGQAVATRADQILAAKFTGENAQVEAKAIVQQVVQSGEVEKYADNAANNFIGGMWERVKLSHQKKVAAALDPIKNASLNRFKVASFQMERPEAMARATRAFMVSMITDKPMELMFLMLFGVGITSGVMAPLQDEMFSENSWFHMSRYLVWNGFISGILISFLADVWMKIQMDYRMDKQNAFDNVPEGADAKRGWWGWFWKQSWTKQNTWWENYTYLLKLSFINMPAYFLTALAINLATMGRFDLDSFLNVYILALLPMSGLHSKFSSAFEAATDWVIRDIPKKFRAHPFVREYRSQASNKKRVVFNLLYNFILNIEYNVLGNFSTMATQALGPRAFSRWFFGGYTPTEHVVMHGLRPIGDAVGGVVKSLTNGCESLLTTNYTDGIKITPKAK